MTDEQEAPAEQPAEEQTEEPAANEAAPSSKKEEKISLIKQANNAAKRIEDANKKMEELLLKQEEAYSRDLLSGRAEAGTAPKEKKEETPAEYAKRVMRGEV